MLQKCAEIIGSMEQWERTETLKQPGAVLVFLPGLREINTVKQHLERIVSTVPRYRYCFSRASFVIYGFTAVFFFLSKVESEPDLHTGSGTAKIRNRREKGYFAIFQIDFS